MGKYKLAIVGVLVGQNPLSTDYETVVYYHVSLVDQFTFPITGVAIPCIVQKKT